VGSRGELLVHCVPSSVPGDPFSPDYFVSLVTQEMVTLMDLTHFDTTQRDPCQEEPGVEGTEGKNRDIHWNIPNDSDFPVFGVFPTIFPLLEGIVLPDTIDLRDPFPTTWPETTPLEFIAWIRAHKKYIWDHNSGKLLHAHSKMFRASRLPAGAAFSELQFVPNPTLSVTLLDFHSTEYDAVRKSFQQARELAYLRVSNLEVFPVSKNDGGNNKNGSAQAVGDAIASSMKDIVENSKMTGAERERKSSQTDAVFQWGILFAHVSDNNLVVEPHAGELSPVFLEILQRQNRSLTVEKYRQEFSDFLATKRVQDPNNFVYRRARLIHVLTSKKQ
jgi:hypothetical protein